MSLGEEEDIEEEEEEKRPDPFMCHKGGKKNQCEERRIIQPN